ncbi:MerR family transcriptional regulator [Actinacidiphila yanglinensis]|uniref:MerR family transcriptional regulator n=1 Tax=Actinacidiphila yanglinensis TaxID=310779 RepID=UPI001F4106D9
MAGGRRSAASARAAGVCPCGLDLPAESKVQRRALTTYRISQLAERCGVPATTLRFYEDTGLLPAERTASGYRTTVLLAGRTWPCSRRDHRSTC